jgi:hypothetical protein
MLEYVGQRLLDDAIDRHVHGGRQSGVITADD